MNMFVPQSMEAEGELECLMQSREHLLCGGQGIVQDTALGCYLLSLPDCIMTKDTFFKCLYFVITELDRDRDLQMHFDLSEVSAGPYNGRLLLSCLFAPEVHVEGFVERGKVVGVLNKGTVKKKLMPSIQKHSGKKELSNFLPLSRISAEFLRRRVLRWTVVARVLKTTDESVELTRRRKTL